MNGNGVKYEKIESINAPPGIWDMTIHKHPAEKAGDHYDLRIHAGDGKVHSWRLEDLPKPGGPTVLAIQQPTHEEKDMDFRGEIKSGYGKTKKGKKMSIVERKMIDVIEADDKSIRFNVYHGKITSRFKMQKWPKHGENNWWIRDFTPKREARGIPDSRPDYSSVKPKSILEYIEGEYALAPKYDGAHLIMKGRPGREIEIFSYRQAKGGDMIEHTPKFEKFMGLRSPKETGEFTIRGEAWAPNLTYAEIGGLLNSNPIDSRLKQKDKSMLDFIGFKVTQFKGKDVENTTTYKENLEMLNEIASQVPIRVTEIADTPDKKRSLFSRIFSGIHKDTREGVIATLLNEPGARPIKIVKTEPHDVIVKEVYPIKSKKKKGAGGFMYALESNPDVIVGSVGTGFSQQQREDLWNDRKNMIGAVAKVEAKNVERSGALRSPVFNDWHIDKDYRTPEFISKTASMKKQDEDIWAEWMIDQKDHKKKEKLLKQFSGLIFSHVNKWGGARVPRSALRAEAERLSMIAFTRYDPGRGASIASYVDQWLGKLYSFQATRSQVMKVPEHRIGYLTDIYNETRARLSSKMGRDPTAVQIADTMKVPLKKFKNPLAEIKRLEAESIGIITESSADLTGAAVANDAAAKQALYSIYYDLTSDEKLVFEHLYGFGGKMKLKRMKDISLRTGFSPSKISRLKNSIYKKVEDYI